MTNRDSNFAWMAGAVALAGTFAIAALGGLSAHARQQAGAPAARPEDKPVAEMPGFYCNLKAFTIAERVRHGLLSHKIAEARVETKELADGYAFRLEAGSVSLVELADWVTNERKCCPFFDFEIEFERDGGPLWLKLRGSEGVKQFICSEFKLQQ